MKIKMSYDLERQHKERRLIFEMEMQNRLYYLANVNKLVDYSIHSLPTKPQNTMGSHSVYSVGASSRDTICEREDKTADNYSRQTKPFEEPHLCKDDGQNQAFKVTPKDKTAEINHIPRDINEWLHEKTHELGEYIK